MEGVDYNMKTKSSLILFFLLAAATAATISSDSYIDLNQQGYVFSFSNAQGLVQLNRFSCGSDAIAYLIDY
jgi:hypothetical protein